MSETEALDFDKVLRHIGPLGKWQWFQSFCLFTVATCSGIGAVTFAFTAYEPNYRCLMPECNESISNASYKTKEAYEALDKMFLGMSIEETGRQCYRFKGVDIACGNYLPNEQAKERCPNSELVFDTSVVSSSAVQDLNIVCDGGYQKTILKSCYTLGMLLAAFIIGFISDTYGRRKALVLSIFLLGISGILKVFTTNKIVFAILRVLHGIGGHGSIIVAFVLSAEIILPEQKVLFIFITGTGFQVGELIYAIAAYFLRDWKTLQLATCIPILCLILLYFVVPESSRWLISRGRTEEAKQILRKRAKFNNVGPIPEHVFQGDLGQKVNGTSIRLSFGQSLIAISR